MKRSEFIQKLLSAAPADVDPEIAIADATLNCYFPSVSLAEKIVFKKTTIDDVAFGLDEIYAIVLGEID